MLLDVVEFCFLGRDPRFWNCPADGRKHCFERRKDLATKRGTSLPTRTIGEGHDYFDAVREERALRGERPRFGWV